VVDDLATDLRWAAYGPKAAALGIGSQVAFQFRAHPHVRGASTSTPPGGSGSPAKTAL
jgi:hypothetical protein